MLAQTGIATVVAPALLIGNLAAADGPDPAVSPVIRALRFFEQRVEHEPADMLKTLRPAPLPLAARAVVLANLPLEGEVQPDKNGRAKLGLLRGVLDLHERDRVFEIKVINVVQAFVGLHARTAILISDRALRLLTGLELQAVVGHEMGHEYFWADYDRAAMSGDSSRRREIELRCDGIAVLTARALKQDRHHLSSALRKLKRFNDALGVLDVTNYPSVEDRERFIEVLAGSLDERAARRATSSTPPKTVSGRRGDQTIFAGTRVVLLVESLPMLCRFRLCRRDWPLPSLTASSERPSAAFIAGHLGQTAAAQTADSCLPLRADRGLSLSSQRHCEELAPRLTVFENSPTSRMSRRQR